MKKFFIWLGWMYWRFPKSFVVFLCILDIFGVFLLVPPRIFVGVGGAISTFIGLLFILLSLFLFCKGEGWKKKERNWRVAVGEGIKLFRQDIGPNLLFYVSLGKAVSLYEKDGILNWIEKEKQRVKLKKELIALEVKLANCSEAVKTLPEAIKNTKEQLAAMEENLNRI